MTLGRLPHHCHHTGKSLTLAVRETSIFRHNGGPIKALLFTPQYDSALMPGALILYPHDAERRQHHERKYVESQ